jgi:hypothetical protein
MSSDCQQDKEGRPTGANAVRAPNSRYERREPGEQEGPRKDSASWKVRGSYHDNSHRTRNVPQYDPGKRNDSYKPRRLSDVEIVEGDIRDKRRRLAID